MPWWLILIMRIVAALVIIGLSAGLGYLIAGIPAMVVGGIVGLVAQFIVFRQCYGLVSLAAIQCCQAETSGGVSRHLSQPVTDLLFGP